MANKHLTVPPNEVALARLKVLLESVNDLYHSGDMVLESNIVSSYHEALNLFYESLDSSILGSVMKIYKGAPADPATYNIFTTALQKDAKALFSEIGALDRLVSSSFNSITSEHNQALQASKKVANKLGDYLLYADASLGAGFFFGDSFNSSDRVEVGSSLVDTDECLVNTDEGIVLLPLDGSPDIPSVKSIIVNQNSNGEAGSNYQLDVFGHEDIEVVSDGEPNTWFEYERVTTNELSAPLVLDITIALDEVSVINHINVNPINFGTPTPIKVTRIETSKDGAEFISIKDEIPIKDFSSEEEKEEFELSPASSKFSGQGFYSFLPRKVQYVHLVLEQHTPYTIETNNGLRLRYSIGIRDINILGRQFLPEGSLVSTPFASSDTIQKVSLWASENPVEESTLADLKHFISHDDGASWLAIQPQRRSGSDIPEIVNFNNISPNSVETGEEVTTLRHKISMKRDTEAFNGDITIKQERLSKMDIVDVPAGGQFDVSLSQTPIEKSVNVLLPFMGSFSCPRARNGSVVRSESAPMDLDFVEFTVDVPGERVRESDQSREGSIRFKLPFKGLPNLEEKIRVFVNGEQIEYCPKTSAAFTSPPTSHTSINSDSKVYFLNKKGTELQFGHADTSVSPDSPTQRGYVPVGGSKIQVCLDGDNPFLRLTDKGYILTLSTPSDGQKESISLVALNNMSDDEVSAYEIEVPPGAERYKYLPDIDPTKSLTDQEKIALNSAAKTSPAFVKQVSASAIGVSNVSLTAKDIDPVKTAPVRSIGKWIGSNQYFQSKSKSEKALESNTGQDNELAAEYDLQNQDLFGFQGTFFVDSYDGAYPPVFLEGISNFDITEYDLSGNVITGTSRQFTDKVAFQDGYTELRNESASWVKVATRYTFDPYTGAVYLGSAPSADRRVVLSCKKRDLKVISQDFWQFDRNTVTGKPNTQKIILDPRVVFTAKRIEEVSLSSSDIRKVSLAADNDLSHNWTNSKLVRGTVKPSITLFAVGAKPIEVKFIDGEREFSNISEVNSEEISFTSLGSNLYSFQLGKIDVASNKTLIGTPAFAPVRSVNSASTTASQFDLTPQVSTATLAANGEWKVDSSGLVTLYLTSTPGSHTVSYRVKNAEPGIDISGMYSVDYDSGVFHLAQPVVAAGNIAFEVSMYSAFYNIAEQVSYGNIENVDTSARTITFNSAFGMRFLKQDTAQKSRPQVLKIFYEYYKKTTESLKDLEPYFSPICKDLAFRAVTSNLLEEL